ncbi:MAG: YIP1 family protein [Methanoregulaceae archaeon]
MIAEYYEKAKGVLLTPFETLQKSREDTPGFMLQYYLLGVFFNAILTVLVALILGGTGILNVFSQLLKQLGWVLPFVGAVGAILVIILMIIIAVILLFVGGVWLHIWVYIAGGRKGYMKTVKAVAYGSTPGMVIGWIPVIGPVIGGIWTFVLGILSVREMQEMPTERAIVAVVLAVLIPIIIALLLLATLVTSLMSGAVMVPGK